MNRSELIAAVATATSLPVSDVSSIVTAIFDGDVGVIASEVASGNDVTLTGFGTFSRKERAARVGVNPATGDKIQVSAKKATKFKAGKSLSAKVAAS